MDIRSAQKAKAAANVIGDRQLVTNYFDPTSRASGSSSQQTGRNAEEGVYIIAPLVIDIPGPNLCFTF